MARRQKPVETAKTDETDYRAPAGTDLSYIAEGLQPLAVRCDSLVMDPYNVKDHGDVDLPAHCASLREFGIRRAVVVRKDNRQIVAGNGTVLASIKNGWEFVPVILCDDDVKTAKAYALADNAVGSLAPWNEENLRRLEEIPDLFESPDLSGLAEQIAASLVSLEEEVTEEETETTPADPDSIKISYRVIAMFATQDEQVKFLAELDSRKIEARLSQSRLV